MPSLPMWASSLLHVSLGLTFIDKICILSCTTCQHHNISILLYSVMSEFVYIILSPKCFVCGYDTLPFLSTRGPYVVEMTMPHPTPVVYKLDVFTLCAQACLMFSKETDAIELKMILSKL